MRPRPRPARLWINNITTQENKISTNMLNVDPSTTESHIHSATASSLVSFPGTEKSVWLNAGEYMPSVATEGEGGVSGLGTCVGGVGLSLPGAVAGDRGVGDVANPLGGVGGGLLVAGGGGDTGGEAGGGWL